MAFIDFAAQSLNGNTALHFAIYNEEYALAYTILSCAEEQGKDDALNDVLFARNNVGKSKVKAGKTDVTSGGELPSMNLVANLRDPRALLQTVVQFFIQCMQDGTPEEQGQVLQLLCDTLSSANPLQSSALVLNHMQKLYPHKGEEIAALTARLDALLLFPKVYGFIYQRLDQSAQAELGHLFTVYQKELEGYCAFNFLKQAIAVKTTGVIEKLDSLVLPEALAKLPAQMKTLQSNMDPALAHEIIGTVDAYLMEDSLDADRQQIVEILTQAKILIAQQHQFAEKTVDDKNQPLILALESAILPLQRELDTVRRDLRYANSGRFYYFKVAYRNDLQAIEKRLADFLADYEQAIRTFAEQPLQDSNALQELGDSLRSICFDPDNQIFKKHPGILGKVLDLIDFIARTVFGSNYFQTSLQHTMEEVDQDIQKTLTLGGG